MRIHYRPINDLEPMKRNFVAKKVIPRIMQSRDEENKRLKEENEQIKEKAKEIKEYIKVLWVVTGVLGGYNILLTILWCCGY